MDKVVYTCYAIPPEGILIGKIYEVGKDKEKGYFYTDGNERVYADKDYIYMLFSKVETKTIAE
jgi:hypothetical protein